MVKYFFVDFLLLQNASNILNLWYLLYEFPFSATNFLVIKKRGVSRKVICVWRHLQMTLPDSYDLGSVIFYLILRGQGIIFQTCFKPRFLSFLSPYLYQKQKIQGAVLYKMQQNCSLKLTSTLLILKYLLPHLLEDFFIPEKQNKTN